MAKLIQVDDNSNPIEITNGGSGSINAATQAEVDAGVIDNKYVSPLTLASSKLNYSGAFPSTTSVIISPGYVCPTDGWVYFHLNNTTTNVCNIGTQSGVGNKAQLQLTTPITSWCGTVPFSRGEAVYVGGNVIVLQFMYVKGAV